MKKQVFVSYSSPDKAKADAIREALEEENISCWIAPRDLSAGAQWGAGIVEAIKECDAVAVVFSDAANRSPQVAREMELAVSNRRPLIPIRVADAMPTDDMQYFLGVSHWFNAYAMPIEAYLPDIITAVKNVLNKEKNTWNTVAKRLPHTRTGQIAWSAAGAVLIAVVVGWLMRPSMPNFTPEDSPLTGRWEAKITTGDGQTTDCTFEVQKMGQVVYSDSCPGGLLGANGTLMVAKDGTAAPKLFRSGDDGSFSFIGGGPTGYVAAFKFGWFGGLTTRDAQFGDVSWSKVSNSEPMKSGMDGIFPDNAPWPVADIPTIARKSTAYVQGRWKKDAQLMNISIKLLKSNEGGVVNMKSSEGGVEITMRYYSPSTQQGVQFEPSAVTSPLFPLGTVENYDAGAIPDDFVDLPAAVEILKARGMRAKQIYAAQLENWGRGTSYGSARLGGLAWMIDSQLSERFVVPATK